MRHYIQSTFVSSYQLNKYVDALSIIIFKYFFTIYTYIRQIMKWLSYY
jgi:hypothetical protein